LESRNCWSQTIAHWPNNYHLRERRYSVERLNFAPQPRSMRCITILRRSLPVMSDTNSQKNPPMEEMDVLERRVSELISLTEQLSRENKALRTQQENWSVERAKLIEKNELAKSRVESMIGRLRALENG
jgi:cell division protein ZapB